MKYLSTSARLRVTILSSRTPAISRVQWNFPLYEKIVCCIILTIWLQVVRLHFISYQGPGASLCWSKKSIYQLDTSWVTIIEFSCYIHHSYLHHPTPSSPAHSGGDSQTGSDLPPPSWTGPEAGVMGPVFLHDHTTMIHPVLADTRKNIQEVWTTRSGVESVEWSPPLAVCIITLQYQWREDHLIDNWTLPITNIEIYQHTVLHHLHYMYWYFSISRHCLNKHKHLINIHWAATDKSNPTLR